MQQAKVFKLKAYIFKPIHFLARACSSASLLTSFNRDEVEQTWISLISRELVSTQSRRMDMQPCSSRLLEKNRPLEMPRLWSAGVCGQTKANGASTIEPQRRSRAVFHRTNMNDFQKEHDMQAASFAAAKFDLRERKVWYLASIVGSAKELQNKRLHPRTSRKFVSGISLAFKGSGKTSRTKSSCNDCSGRSASVKRSKMTR